MAARTRVTAALAAMAAAVLPVLLAPDPAGAVAEPTPSPGASAVGRAGTSFLTATGITPGQPVRLGATTADHLYWSTTAVPGQLLEISATVTLPPAGKRTGPSTWAVEVFDGLRRRQACTAGAQAPTVAADATEVTLSCVLRRIRSWAEPWSGDPLPGTYYVRLSVTDLPEADLGLPVQVEMLLGATDAGTSADDGTLREPLVPAARPGSVLTSPAPADPSASPSPSAGADDDGVLSFDWVPAPSARWIWTVVGGVLAAAAGVVGFSLTWRRR